MLATLRSNSGDEEVAFEFGPSEDYAHEAGALLAVHLRGEHYDGDHTHDFAVRVDGLWGRLADVISLRDHIAAWVSRPMADLDPRLLDREFRLCRLPGQELDLAFGTRSDVISGENPVLTISFAAGKLKGECYLVADQSCLDVFARELSACVEFVTE